MASFEDSVGTLISENEDLKRLAAPLPTRCTATAKHKSKDGKAVRCSNTPMPGQRVCYIHGGKAPNAIAAGEERVQLQSAVNILKRLGEEVQPWERKDPREALLDVVHQAFTLKGALEALIRDLDEEEVSGLGSVIQVQGELGPIHLPHRGGAKTAVRIKLYNESLDRCAKYSKMALDAGIEERLVRLAEKQSEVIAQVIKNAVKELPEELQMKVMVAAANELRFRSATPVQAVPIAQLESNTTDG